MAKKDTADAPSVTIARALSMLTKALPKGFALIMFDGGEDGKTCFIGTCDRQTTEKRIAEWLHGDSEAN